jgi:hypothetical protein
MSLILKNDTRSLAKLFALLLKGIFKSPFPTSMEERGVILFSVSDTNRPSYESCNHQPINIHAAGEQAFLMILFFYC